MNHNEHANIPAIETHDLTKRYGKARGIFSVNLRVERGEIFGFLGPNGAGKTTTIRTLARFHSPHVGVGAYFRPRLPAGERGDPQAHRQPAGRAGTLS